MWTYQLKNKDMEKWNKFKHLIHFYDIKDRTVMFVKKEQRDSFAWFMG